MAFPSWSLFAPTIVSYPAKSHTTTSWGLRGRYQRTRDIGQAFVIADDQPCQVILKMVKLAPILKEVSKGVRVREHQGSGSHDGKLHEAFTLSREGTQERA